jgi:hypothetical protein
MAKATATKVSITTVNLELTELEAQLLIRMYGQFIVGPNSKGGPVNLLQGIAQSLEHVGIEDQWDLLDSSGTQTLALNKGPNWPKG